MNVFYGLALMTVMAAGAPAPSTPPAAARVAAKAAPAKAPAPAKLAVAAGPAATAAPPVAALPATAAEMAAVAATPAEEAPSVAPAAAAPGAASPPAAPEATPASNDWLGQTDAHNSPAAPAARWPLVLALLLVLAAAGAFVALRSRNGQLLWSGGVPGHAIDILAIKALGHKHRLVLVEASGERLLLSATEHEVRLLSHIASQEASHIEATADVRQVDALANAMGAGPTLRPPEPVPAPAPAVAAAAQAAPVTVAPLHMAQPVPPASGGSLSAEALYEGAARSMDLDEHDDDPDERAALAPDAAGDGMASDVAGLARWRQAAAQGADPWGKHA